MNPAKTNGHLLLKIEDPPTLKSREIPCRKGENLLAVLQEHGVPMSAYCGGKGTCGKCAISVREGALPITGADRLHFSKEALFCGMRLSCKAILQEDLTISLNAPDESAFIALGSGSLKQIPAIFTSARADESYAIAIDIGTTTLAFSLLEKRSGKIFGTHTSINSQRSFGADVISRIQASCNGKREILQRLIKKDLQSGCIALLKKCAVAPKRIRQIAIAANTVMLHLLRGYSCEGLSRYPFSPKNLGFEELSSKELFDETTFTDFTPKVTILPGISAFVGADILAGLYACNIKDSPDGTLFLDLGTNGEMALKKNGQIFAASTAAGPVFEGANITHGMGSLPGAISQVKICGQAPQATTIGHMPPAGICGTGAIETTAELLSSQLIDKTGKLAEPYFSQGYPLAQKTDGTQILFTQKDIREIQMAKAAIRAGIEILCLCSGVPQKDIRRIFLAGGFGYFLNTQKAAAIGLLPRDFASKTKAIGNASLKGALFYLANQDKQPLFDIIGQTACISLANDDKFQELYLSYINF